MPRRPNVIVFFTDQQRHDSTGLHGNPLDLTPNFDRLASDGTHVKHFFTCQPVCGPARACWQTGMYATAAGVHVNGRTITPGLPTLAEQFSRAGYRTGYFGKWHLGEPQVLGPVKPEYRAGYQDWLASNVLEFTSDAYETVLWDANNQPHNLPGYRVDALTDAVIRYVDERARSEQPFFTFVSYIEPHHQNHRDNYPAPHGYEERYRGRWTPPDLQALGGSSAQHLAGYWGMIKRLDEALGRLQDALVSLRIADDTIVLFTSDHGNHFKTRNGEYKRSCHDSSIRVPCGIWGGPFRGGGAIDELVSLVDLPPTLLDACGVAVPPTMQGRSMLPLVNRALDAWPEEVFVQISESHVGRALRTHRWKYAITGVDVPEGPQPPGVAKYVESHLYDLESDPHELCNLVDAASFGDVRAELRGRMMARMRAAGEPEPIIETVEPKGRGQRAPSLKLAALKRGK